MYNRHETLLKIPNMNMNLQAYVSGRYRMNFIKRPVVEKEEDSTPVMYLVIN